MDVKFDNLMALHLLWGVPVLILLYLYGFARRRAALNRFAAANVLPHLVPDLSTARRNLKAALAVAAITALIVAATGPRWGLHWQEVPHKGIDIMVALDVSRSMLAEDVTPNRLERAKLYIGDLVRRLPGDRIGLVTFGGKAVVSCPLTTSYGWLLLALDRVDVYSSPEGGSAVGDAIRAAADAFVDRVKDYKAILLITDGEDQESYPVEAARAVYEEQGIRVYTVGMGDSVQGGRIPVEKDGQSVYLTYEGQEVWSKMNPDLLRDTALAGGGAFIPAGVQSIDLGEIYETRIATLAQREFESTRVQRYDAQYQWFAALALVLILIETFISERKATVATESVAPARP